MAALTSSIEISRSPEDVFAYAVDPANLAAWQENVVSAQANGPLQTGTTVTTSRRVGPREQVVTMQFTRYDAPNGWSMRGVDGPILPQVVTRIEPIDAGARTRVSIELDFRGQGIGRLLVPLLVRPQARKGLPRNLQLLKERLEATA
jgi:uncharacterized protein YndB with AHSA1/START domain